MLRTKNKLGSNQYRTKRKTHYWEAKLWFYITIVLCIISGNLALKLETKVAGSSAILTPLAHAQEISPTPTPNVMEDQAKWIAIYAEKYEKPQIGKSKSLLAYQLACLAHKENGWHANNSCGDNGLACGMYQYHEATWEGFRKDMMQEGLVASMSSRLNDQDAIETTAWALANGHELDWGPILRGGCQ